MTKLNQIVAIENSTKAAAEAAKTKAYHTVQSTALFVGRTREYTALEELPDGVEAEHLPSESQLVQTTVEQQLKNFAEAMTALFDITATKTWANTTAFANIELDGQVILEHVPVEYMLFLDKQLDNLMTFLNALPVLDPAQNWKFNEQTGYYSSDTVTSNRNRKVKKVLTLAPASEKFPAQAQIFDDEVVTGRWSTTYLSGAASATRVAKLKARCLALQKAVKVAREEANSIEVTNRQIGETVFNYLFAA